MDKNDKLRNRRVVILDDELMREIAILAIEGLMTDGAHHKQWFLEQILIKIGFDKADMYLALDYPEAIAP